MYTAVLLALIHVANASPHAPGAAPNISANISANNSIATASSTSLPDPDEKTGGLNAALALPDYAGGAGDALQLCCVATWCTTSVIDDCDLLSPGAKAVAGGTAIAGGLLGFGAGFAAAVLLTSPGGDQIFVVPLGEVIRADAEGYTTLGLLGGTAGVLLGGALGLTAAIVVDPWLRFFSAPAPRERRDRSPYAPGPPTTPEPTTPEPTTPEPTTPEPTTPEPTTPGPSAPPRP